MPETKNQGRNPNKHFSENLGISVVMPVHNGGSYLQLAVDSILDQTHKKLELLIVDDNSNDHAIQKLKTDERVEVFSSPQKGIVAALNFGFSKARYPYFARMDADDISVPHRLETQLNFMLEHPEIEISGAKVKLFKDQEKIGGGYKHYEQWINHQCTAQQINKNFFIESCIPHPTLLMRRSVFEKLGGYHDPAWPEDYDLWCRAHLAGYQFGKPEGGPLLYWRDYSSRTSRVAKRYSKQSFLQCKARYLSEWMHLQNRTRCLIWGAGPTGLKLHDYLTDSGIHVSGFIDVNPKLQGRAKRDKPIEIIEPNPKAATLRRLSDFIVVAVSARGARDEIRNALINAGLVELEHFVLAA